MYIIVTGKGFGPKRISSVSQQLMENSKLHIGPTIYILIQIPEQIQELEQRKFT